MTEPRHPAPAIARLSIALLSLLLPACATVGTPDPTPDLQAMVGREWAEYQSVRRVSEGGLALHVVAPRGTYSASTGLGDIHVPTTHFRAGSNTKTFTAAAIMLLYQEGRLDIDQTITSAIPGRDIPYVPDTPQYRILYKKLITIRQLLAHMGSVFDNSNNPVPAKCLAPYAGWYYNEYVTDKLGQGDHTFTFDELVEVNATCRLSKLKPGDEQSYSNTGYDLLGKIIERVSGLPYGEFVAQRLIAPNRLGDTTVPSLGTDQDIPAPLVAGYAIDNGVIEKRTRTNVSGNVAEGNIISTPADLARWVKLLITGNAGVAKGYVEQMQVCADPHARGCYGLGIFRSPGLGWGHNGAIQGYISLMLYNPDDDVAVVVFSNVLDADHIAEELALLVKVASNARVILGYGGTPAP